MGPFWEILEKMIAKTRFGWDPFCSWWIAEGSINGTYGVPYAPEPEKGWVGLASSTGCNSIACLACRLSRQKTTDTFTRERACYCPTQPKIK